MTCVHRPCSVTANQRHNLIVFHKSHGSNLSKFVLRIQVLVVSVVVVSKPGVNKLNLDWNIMCGRKNYIENWVIHGMWELRFLWNHSSHFIKRNYPAAAFISSTYTSYFTPLCRRPAMWVFSQVIHFTSTKLTSSRWTKIYTQSCWNLEQIWMCIVIT